MLRAREETPISSSAATPSGWRERERERKMRSKEKRREETKRGSSLVARTPRVTIRKNLLIGDPDLCRALRSYPRGSPSGAVYLDEADPQPHHTPSPTGHHRRSPTEEERASRRFSVHFPSALPRIRVISRR